MKKILSILATSALLIGMLATGASAERGLSYTAPYGTPTIDGKIDKVWDNAKWTNVDLPHDGNANTDITCKVKVMHDDKLVYFLAQTTDNEIGKGDSVEFYFDEDNCKTDDAAKCEYFTQLGVHLDGSTNKGSRSKTDVDAIKEFKVVKEGDVYTLEWSFALKNGIPAADKTIAFELMCNNNKADGGFKNALRWNADTANGDGAPYKATTAFGKISFAEKPAAPAVAETTPDLIVVPAMLAVASAAAVVTAKKKH